MNRYQALLAEYREILSLEERVLAAIMLSHGGHSPKFRRQRNKVQACRLQVAELEKLVAEVTK